MDILQGSFRLCNWLSLRHLVSWINHLPPACWSTFWKSNFKQQLGCRFDIMDNISYFFFLFWHMQLYMSWYIRSFFGFTFLNILYFFKYSCANTFHRRSLYNFYKSMEYCSTKYLVKKGLLERKNNWKQLTSSKQTTKSVIQSPWKGYSWSINVKSRSICHFVCWPAYLLHHNYHCVQTLTKQALIHLSRFLHKLWWMIFWDSRLGKL